MTKNLVVAIALLSQILGAVLAHACAEMAMGFQGYLAVGGIKTFHDGALIAEDHAGGASGSLAGAFVAAGEALVGLPAGCVTKMPVTVGWASHVGEGIGAGGYGLGPQSL